MSQQNEGIKTFTAGADLEAYRRVKLSSGNVVYADAGEASIGITQQKVANGESVAVALKSASRTYKLTAAGAISQGATFYGANAGKIQASAAGSPQGTLLEASTSDGEIVEGILNDGEASSIDGATTAIGDPAVNGAVPILFAKEGITDASTAVNIVASAPFKFRILDWWIVSRDVTAANVKIQNGASDASANIAKGTTNDALVRGGTIVAAQKDILAAGALKVLASVAAAFDVYVLARKVS